MAKAGELQWDEFLNKSADYKHKPTALWVNDPSSGVAPKTEGVKPLLKNDEVPDSQTDEEIRAVIMNGMNRPGLRQPTDAELFGHLTRTQEQVDAAKAEFDNRMNSTIAKLHTPVTGKTFEQDEEWASGQSFNSTLSKSELEKRNMFTGEE
jgi:hypothetical protein